jgi:RNA ligase
MFYNFPKIKHIDDVLPAVEGRKEFVVAERVFGTVINYSVNMPDTFDIDEDDLMSNYGRAIPKGIMRRECRGLIFFPDGKLMSRPFHKFFNVGEREETQFMNIDMSRDHTIMEKMDGSMIRPIYSEGKFHVATKMGLSDVAIQCQEHVTEAQLNWMEIMMKQNVTPLFEFISPENRIVIDYSKTELVLLAMRENISGKYLDIEGMRGNAFFPVVPTYGSVEGNLEEYITRQREAEDREGDIVRFANGHMFKAKNDWYVRIHKTLDRVRFDRNIVDLIVHENMDDVVPMMPEHEMKRIRNFEKKFWVAFEQKQNRLYGMGLAAREYDGDRKRIALEFIPHLPNRTDAQFVFRMVDGNEPRDLLLDYIRKNITSNVKWDDCAEWLGIKKE